MQGYEVKSSYLGRRLVHLEHKLVHHNKAHFLSIRATSLTFLSSGASLYSKILLTVCIHSRNSSGSSLPSNPVFQF